MRRNTTKSGWRGSLAETSDRCRSIRAKLESVKQLLARPASLPGCLLLSADAQTRIVRKPSRNQPDEGERNGTAYLDKLGELLLELFEPCLLDFVLLDELGLDRTELFSFLLKAVCPAEQHEGKTQADRQRKGLRDRAFKVGIRFPAQAHRFRSASSNARRASISRCAASSESPSGRGTSRPAGGCSEAASCRNPSRSSSGKFWYSDLRAGSAVQTCCVRELAASCRRRTSTPRRHESRARCDCAGTASSADGEGSELDAWPCFRWAAKQGRRTCNLKCAASISSLAS